MSFNTELRNELVSISDRAVHCRIAQLAGYISINGRMEEYEDSEVLAIRVDSDESEAMVQRLIRMITKIPDETVLCKNEKKHHRKVIITGDTEELFQKLKLRRYDNRLSVDGIITQRGCCKKAYFRGAFLAGGSVGDPEKSYQMEIATLSQKEADRLINILSVMDMKAGLVEHRDRFVVYTKNGDTIADMLGFMGAASSLMNFENIRILKEIKNSINREVNCDTANMAKVARSSAKQIDDIQYIVSTVGMDYLPEGLRDIAVMRLEYPYLSLKELGEAITPPLGKSGVSHRLRKLSDIADKLRDEK